VPSRVLAQISNFFTASLGKQDGLGIARRPRATEAAIVSPTQAVLGRLNGLNLFTALSLAPCLRAGSVEWGIYNEVGRASNVVQTILSAPSTGDCRPSGSVKRSVSSRRSLRFRAAAVLLGPAGRVDAARTAGGAASRGADKIVCTTLLWAASRYKGDSCPYWTVRSIGMINQVRQAGMPIATGQLGQFSRSWLNFPIEG
jgi:hypothetical protein